SVPRRPSPVARQVPAAPSPSRPGSPAPARFGRSFLLWSLFVFGTDAAAVFLLGFPIALEAHWGGFATGAFLAWALAAIRPRAALRAAAIVAFAVVLAAGALYLQRPVFNSDYRRFLADREFLLAGPERGRDAYRELADRGDQGALVRLALACYEAGDLAEARRLLEEKPRDEDAFEAFVKLDLMVTVLDETGDRPEADLRFEELVEKSRAWSLAKGGGERPADNNFAMHCADHSRRLPEAEEAILGIVLRDIDPTYRDTLGWVYLRRGNPRSALIACEASWELYPVPEIAYHLAEIHAALGDPERALEWAAEALSPRRHIELGHPGSTLFYVAHARKLRARLETEPRAASTTR
ncbi:MAG: tetratricopeptide repeat protein, partial [Planctomycetes bacterium]|nr:tetratricopeptide repeat protein [Planctomycetota bacterium]